MNKPERNSLIAITVAMTLATVILIAFVSWLLLAVQTINDVEVCQQPLDQLKQADYQFCLQRDLK